MKKVAKGTKIDKRVRIEIAVLGKACKEKRLLEALMFGEAVIVANRPPIRINLIGLDTCNREG